MKNYNPNLVFRVIVKQVLLYESSALDLSLKCHNVDSEVGSKQIEPFESTAEEVSFEW